MKKLVGLLLAMSAITFSKELTLESAIDLALENGKSIKATELSKTNANLDVKRAFKKALPTVAYQGKYERNEISTKQVFVSDGVQANYKSGYIQTIRISQPIFQGGVISGGIKGAKALESIANINYLIEKRDVRLDIIEIYSNIIKYERDLTVFESSMKELEARYNKQKEQLDLKLITKADILKTEVSILELETEIEAKNTDLLVAKSDLKLKLGINSTEEIDLNDFVIPENLLKDVNFDKDMEQALTDSLTAKMNIDKIELSKAEETVTRASMLPQVELYGTYGSSREARKFADSFDNAEWRGGLSVNWNVFNFGEGLNDYKTAKNETMIEELNKQASLDEIVLSVTRSYKEVVRLEKLIISRKKGLEASKENLDIDTERYNAGLISTVDYLESEKQYRESAVDYNAAILDYYVAFEKYRSLLI